MADHPIGDYALLSDCHGSGLVNRAGSIDWLCLPRFDSPAVFARLLDANGGHWSIRPMAPFSIRRGFVDDTMALQTRFSTDNGAITVLDTLAAGPNDEPHGHELGAHAPHILIREVRCTRGEVMVDFDFQPRPEYGLIASLLQPVEGGIVARGGATRWLLSCPDICALEIEDATVHTQFLLREGDCQRFALHYESALDPPASCWSFQEIGDEIKITTEAWQRWSNMHQSYDGPWREWVHHSGRILQALTYFKTGAIVAAPTTSLPEEVGGQRNWDYRYTWVRDASFTLDALWVAACPDEAYKFIDFLAHAALTKLERKRDMQILYGIAGEHDVSERELTHLSGWRKSAPVRVGNAAWNQLQLDVYGELLAAVYRLRETLEDLDPLTRKFLIEVADAAARRWQQPDRGIWEIRAEPRHFLYSKLMCWLALDRAIEMADWLDAGAHVNAWKITRDQIRQTILERGWNEDVRAFTQVFDEPALDASSLVIPMVGFLAGDHPRVLSTIDAIENELTDNQGLVYRYRTDDGLAGQEGSFLLCTFWLAHARALAGQTRRAREIFERAIACANDLKLFSEQVDPNNQELLGNFPQALSHIGLVNAAWAIHEAEQDQRHGTS